jgi:hypothetical protein
LEINTSEEVLSTDGTAGTFVRVGKNSGTGLTLGDGRPDARRVLGGTDEESGPVEDNELRQEKWQKLIEENRKLREAFEVLQRWQASFEGSVTPGPQRQVPTTPFTAMLGRVNRLEVTDTLQSRQLYQVRNDSMVVAQPVSASTAGLFGPFLDQTLRMAPQAPGSVFEVSRSNFVCRKPLDVEKEAKSLLTFAGDKQSKEEILLHNCINFVQAVQDVVDQYKWQEAGVFIAIASRFTGFASTWFCDWKLNHAMNLT